MIGLVTWNSEVRPIGGYAVGSVLKSAELGNVLNGDVHRPDRSGTMIAPGCAVTPAVSSCFGEASAASICHLAISEILSAGLLAIAWSPATSLVGGAIAMT